jgi:hypothetical protein
MNSFLLIQYLSFKYSKISLLLLLEKDSSSPNILLHFHDFKSIPSISIRLRLYNVAFDKYSTPLSPILLSLKLILVNVLLIDKAFDKYSNPSSPTLL